MVGDLEAELSSATQSKVFGYGGLGLFVALVVQFFVAPQPPGFDATGAEIREYFVDNRTGLLVAGLLQLVAVAFLLLLTIGLARAVRPAANGDALALGVLLGAVLTAATVIVGQAVYNAPLWIDGLAGELGDDSLRVLWSLAFLLFGSLAPSVFFLAGSIAVAGLRSATFPKVTSWLCAVIAVLALVGMFTVLGSGVGWMAFLSYIGIIVFSLAVSIPMLMGKVTIGAV